MTLQAMQRSLHIDLPLIGHLCHWGGALHRYSVCARLLVVRRLSCREPFLFPAYALIVVLIQYLCAEPPDGGGNPRTVHSVHRARNGAAILTCVFGPPDPPPIAADYSVRFAAASIEHGPIVTSSQRRGTASACIGLLPVRLPPMPRACRVRSLAATLGRPSRPMGSRRHGVPIGTQD